MNEPLASFRTKLFRYPRPLSELFPSLSLPLSLISVPLATMEFSKPSAPKSSPPSGWSSRLWFRTHATRTHSLVAVVGQKALLPPLPRADPWAIGCPIFIHFVSCAPYASRFCSSSASSSVCHFLPFDRESRPGLSTKPHCRLSTLVALCC